MDSFSRGLGLAGLFGFLAAACGGSSAKPGTASACDDYAKKQCDREAACAPGAFAIVGDADEAACQTYAASYCQDWLEAAHTAWTPSLVEQCGDGFAAMSCPTYLAEGTTPSACLPHGGTLPNGASCTTPWQCASGRCSVDSINACGACVPVAALGEPCISTLLGTDCADNLVCALTPTSPTTPVCAAPVSLGGACADTSVCPGDDYCDLTTHVCTKLPALGQACDANAFYYCDPTKTGAVCDSTSGTCLAVTAISTGGACGLVDGGISSCAGTCAYSNPDGGEGTCNPFGAEGAACAADAPCLPGLVCAGGVCTSAGCDGTADAATTPASALRRPGRARLSRIPFVP
jgi:hypothetical protein